MQKTIFTLIIGLMLSSFAYGQTDDWINFSSEKGNFSVSFPTQPEIEESNNAMQPTDLATGRLLDKKVRFTANMFTSKEPDSFYLVGWVDYEAGFNFDVEGELDANRDNFLKGVQATLISQKIMKFDGYPALEFSAERSPNMFIKGKVIIIGKRPFILIGVTTNQDETAGIEKFFSSFKINKKK
jgi:hypothetical protein